MEVNSIIEKEKFTSKKRTSHFSTETRIPGKIYINEINIKMKEGDCVYYISSSSEMANFIQEYTEENYEEYLKDPLIRDENELDMCSEFKQGFSLMVSQCLSKYTDHSVKYKKYKNERKSLNNPSSQSNSNEENNNISYNNFVNLFRNLPQFDFKNHIIILTELKQSFLQILSILRKYSKKPIILFSQSFLDKEKTIKIKKFHNLFYFYGSYVNIRHIELLQIEKAFKVMILPIDDNNKLFPDSDSVIVTRIIKDKYPNVDLLIEFSDENSLRFLDKRPACSVKTSRSYNYYNYNFWPNVINGNVFLSSIFYTFFSKSFYDDIFLKLIKEITGFNDENNLNTNFKDLSQQKINKNKIIHTLIINEQIQKVFKTYGRLIWYILNYTPELIPLAFERSNSQNKIFESFGIKTKDKKEKSRKSNYRNTLNSSILSISSKKKKKRIFFTQFFIRKS